jgi:hypothetical protein
MELRLLMFLALVGMMEGCAVYSDDAGHPIVASAFDQGAIKAELKRAEREYGGQ